jgi:membrane associated rhomboid family serine protease
MLLEELKRQFKQSDNAVNKLIWLNVIVFVVIRLIGVALELFVYKQSDVAQGLILPYLAMSDSLIEFVRMPWTLFTNMFTHWDFMHLLFNMFGLYFVGQFFSQELGQKRLLALYFIFGLGANLFWFALQQAIPFYVADRSVVLGASAAIVGLMFALATFYPHREVMLFFVLRIKLYWIAIVSLVLYLVSLTGGNGGGELGHLGGAIMGFVFAKLYLKGTDITKPIVAVFDKIESLFKKKAKIKVTYSNYAQGTSKADEVQHNYNNISQDKVDEILDKLKVSGYASLSAHEKRILFEYSKQ